ncbi:SsDNA exonuclease, RecJ [[Clostridium] ultunense Esp]|uniref:Single-stranded-DNA-specific exonuclease RecJ n=1 Tax=[Clostridium] ultunense Esp TaxID=1288971 RepID=M1YSP7_9FIRM|nr:single-stranded-DNA-specific exonuclease RecJ [Schnuerera ultunensis]CCQ93580.1 SsDNA exonuclease, RecJ [[Clostridium] ultunense Esp]SHD76900.1 SsDNA exonuclease, RecJ [[Clostridium] ultunense Esp]
MERWYLKNLKADLGNISNSLGISKLLAKLIVNRGIKDLKLMDSFVYPSLEKLHNPRLMKDIELGVDLMKKSIINGERIRISGDYDQDGNSAILTLYNGIKRCGGNVDYVIPHRVKDGYGINERIIKEAKEDGINLIITCDNGISALDAMKLAKDLGLKIIVTDHHDVSFAEDQEGNKEYILPEADAVINPKRPDCNYPFKELCGAGVAFKFVQVLYEEFGIDVKESYELLEFVAMGTVCDVVDLIDENRIIVNEGLKRINNTENIGLKALINATGLEGKQINTYSLGFILGPCVNASGRLDSAEIAVEMFLTKDPELAKEYAEELYELNEERKRMTEKGFKRVIDQIELGEFGDEKVLVIYEPETHESIVGIIAGRVKDRYYRPTILLTQSKDENTIKGSGRSIEEYNMFEEISKCKDLLIAFGGHPMAAGVSLDIANLETFRERLNGQASLSGEDLLPKIYIDVYLPLDYISFNLVEELKTLEPFGKGNPKPLFADKNLSTKRAFILGKNQNVLKLLLVTKNGRTIDGLYFGDIEEFNRRLAEKFGVDELEKLYKGIDSKIRIDIIYTPNINEYMGNRNLQVIIQNYR